MLNTLQTKPFSLALFLIVLFAGTATAEERNYAAEIQEANSRLAELQGVIDQANSSKAEVEIRLAELQSQQTGIEADLQNARRKASAENQIRIQSDITEQDTFLFPSLRKTKGVEASNNLRRCRPAFIPPAINFPRVFYACFWRIAKSEAWRTCSDENTDLYTRNFSCQTGSIMACRLPITGQKISNCHSKFYPATRAVIAQLDQIQSSLAQAISEAERRLESNQSLQREAKREIQEIEGEKALMEQTVAAVTRQLEETQIAEQNAIAQAKENARLLDEWTKSGKCAEVSRARDAIERERQVCLRQSEQDCIRQGFGNQLSLCLTYSPCGTGIKSYRGRDGICLKKRWLDLSEQYPLCPSSCEAGGVYQFGGGGCYMPEGSEGACR